MIDFSSITRDDPSSILRESLILKSTEIEKRLAFKQFKMSCQIANFLDSSSNLTDSEVDTACNEYLDLQLPWQHELREASLEQKNPGLASFLDQFKQVQNEESPEG